MEGLEPIVQIILHQQKVFNFCLNNCFVIQSEFFLRSRDLAKSSYSMNFKEFNKLQ